MSNRALFAEELHVSYGKSFVLWDVNFEIPKGILVGIIGPNGAGKSTLLKAAMGLIEPLSGKISFGKGVVSYVPQRASVDWDFPITAYELVLMGRYGQLGLFGRPRKADREAAMRALERVGMLSFAQRQIGQLSGGQQQRLFIARALVNNPDIFLMDEPFAGIDLATEKELIALLRQEKEKGKTLFVVHHDLPSVEKYFDWVILLNTRLVGVGPVKEVFTRENLVKTFGHHPSLFDEATALKAQQLSGHV